MATFMDTSLVKYLCSCGKKFPICRLYLCKHCLMLRCIDCVQHEVDTPFCPNCLEGMSSAEAKVKKNRCGNCFDCPLCGHTLMTRATTSHVAPASPANADEAAKTQTKKMYYMACGFCRWSTRDVSLPDQSVATGNWPVLENPHTKRITSLLENFKMMAQVEKAERERKKYVKRRNQLYLQEKYGLNSAAMKRKGLSSFTSQSLPGDLDPSPTVDSFEPLPEETFTAPADLNKITKLVNRLTLVEFQPPEMNKLHPIHKHLLMKKSLRCKECEHNLSKPDLNPTSIKLKLQLTALHHVPEVRIMNPSTFTFNKETVVTLTLSNPSVYNMTVCLKQIEDETDTDFCTAKIDLPKKELVLAGRDEPSMQINVDTNSQNEFKDDSKVIVFRKANKIGTMVKVTPLAKTGSIKVCFLVRHEFRTTTVMALQSESKEPEVTWLEMKVYLHLGEI